MIPNMKMGVRGMQAPPHQTPNSAFRAAGINRFSSLLSRSWRRQKTGKKCLEKSKLHVVNTLMNRNIVVTVDLSNVRNRGGFRFVFSVILKPNEVANLKEGLKGLLQVQEWIDRRVYKRKSRTIDWESAEIVLAVDWLKINSPERIEELIQRIRAPVTGLKNQVLYLHIIRSEYF